tara:strand:- start:174 stop:1193 length:1020 start_codon:yes stop_codon:yes gene_type:complete
MPNGWRKNAKYFNHLEMSHSEYVKKKKKFRKWKKKECKGPFIDSIRRFSRDDDCQDLFKYCSRYKWRCEYFNVPDILSENDKSMYSLYISKQDMKKSNNTFRKRGMGNAKRPSRWKREKDNHNKYSGKWVRKHDKVYYNTNDNYIKTFTRKAPKEEVQKDMCSICCETKSTKELFTVHCKGKRIGSFKKNQDKIICNECRSKLDTCPYCRSHALKCVKYKSSREKSMTLCSAQQWERKSQSRELLNNVSEFEWRKRARKKMYPDKLLWVYNGEVTFKEYINRRHRCDFYQQPRPLPLKLYKYYLNKNIEYTHFKNIDDEVYDAYEEIPEPEYYIGSIKV